MRHEELDAEFASLIAVMGSNRSYDVIALGVGLLRIDRQTENPVYQAIGGLESRG